jgi:hypothetical protein
MTQNVFLISKRDHITIVFGIAIASLSDRTRPSVCCFSIRHHHLGRLQKESSERQAVHDEWAVAKTDITCRIVVIVMIVAITSRSGECREGVEMRDLPFVSSGATVVGRTIMMTVTRRLRMMLIGPEGISDRSHEERRTASDVCILHGLPP